PARAKASAPLPPRERKRALPYPRASESERSPTPRERKRALPYPRASESERSPTPARAKASAPLPRASSASAPAPLPSQPCHYAARDHWQHRGNTAARQVPPQSRTAPPPQPPCRASPTSVPRDRRHGSHPSRDPRRTARPREARCRSAPAAPPAEPPLLA